MSLLATLLDYMPPTVAGDEKPAKIEAIGDRPRPVLVKRANLVISSAYASAATATPEWRHARDLYLNHLMACRACHAPTARHCQAGVDLRASYDYTPMEAHV
jgi:hypothetical protein